MVSPYSTELMLDSKLWMQVDVIRVLKNRYPPYYINPSFMELFYKFLKVADRALYVGPRKSGSTMAKMKKAEPRTPTKVKLFQSQDILNLIFLLFGFF